MPNMINQELVASILLRGYLSQIELEIIYNGPILNMNNRENPP